MLAPMLTSHHPSQPSHPAAAQPAEDTPAAAELARRGYSPRHALAAIGLTIAGSTGRPFRAHFIQPVAGGQTHHAYIVSDGRERYFVKLARAADVALFEAERDGLNALRIAGVPVPGTIGLGTGEGHAHLVLECLDLREPDVAGYVRLAHALATLHSQHGSHFGWTRPNFIGVTEQANPPAIAWARFWRDARLAPQLRIAAAKGAGGLLQSLGERVLDAVPKILGGHQPRPALVHGDLWHGNFGILATGMPVFFDPAVHFADREVDLAMTELFGGFPRDFYAAYHERLPFQAGYTVRRELYNLYHVLNHLNTFGGIYREQAEIRMRALLAEVSA